MFLSVIVPVYNEAKVIKDTLIKIDDYLKNKDWLSEIIVVNDGSTDSSLQKIIQLPIENLNIISNSQNLGKGAAVKKGMLKSQGDLLLFLDADYSASIEELDKFLPRLKEDYDIIIGSRGLKESKILVSQAKIKVFLGKLGNKLIQLFVVPGIKDTQCGFKLYTKKCKILFEKQLLKRWGFDFEILFLARKFNLKILELPISWKNSSSSRVKFLDYPNTFLELIKIGLNNLKGIYEKK